MRDSAITPATVLVRLLQRLSIHRGGLSLESRLSSKARELFCFLLLYRHHPHRRETLATVLWPNGEPARSRQYLRKTLWQLLTALNREADVRGTEILRLEDEWIGVNPQADIWLDADALERGFDTARRFPGRNLDPAAARLVQQAVDLYRGDLLEGWYMEWCLLERERLQSMYLVLLDRLISYYEASGDYESGMLCGARALRCDRASERTHRLLMRLRYLAGDRTGALRQFDRCVAALREELGVSPSEHTLELYRQIQSDALGVPQRNAPQDNSPLDKSGFEVLPALWPAPRQTSDTPPGGLPQLASG